METRTRIGRKSQKVARAFMTHNILNKTPKQIQSDFDLGMRLKEGRITTVSDVTKAITILNELVLSERISKKESDNMKMDLAKRMAGFKTIRR